MTLFTFKHIGRRSSCRRPSEGGKIAKVEVSSLFFHWYTISVRWALGEPDFKDSLAPSQLRRKNLSGSTQRHDGEAKLCICIISCTIYDLEC